MAMAGGIVNILLIGPRASGKTTVGTRLAEALRWRFLDLDEVALSRFPEESVRQVWARHSEKAWRAAEAAALEQVLSASRQVIALGGGTPLINEARQLIETARREGAAWVVYLQANAETLRRRLVQEAGDRPSLTGGDVAEEVAAVLRQREPAYLGLADFVCDASEDPEAITERILAALPVDSP